MVTSMGTIFSCLFLPLIYVHTSYAHSTGTMTSAEIAKLKSTYLPAAYASTNFTLDDTKRLLHKKCKKAGSQNAKIYEEIEAASAELMQCTKNFANFTQMHGEIEAARLHGALDEIFQKYCDKRSHLEQCLLNFNAHLLPCLTPDERAQNAIMMRVVSALLGFLCHKNGDIIAMFIAEEGPECLEMQKENIGNCMNASFAGYIRRGGQLNTMNELPELVLSSQQCIDFADSEECVLGYLEQCNQVTPANIIESVFKYVKNETKCEQAANRNGGTGVGLFVGVGAFNGLILIFMLSFAFSLNWFRSVVWQEV